MKKIFNNLAFTILGTGIGIAIGRIMSQKVIYEKNQMSDKHLALFMFMNQWVKIKQKGGSVADYLESYGYKKIAIYGMSFIGQTLVQELKDSSVEIVCGIDKNADRLHSNTKVIDTQDRLPEVDAIVVTAITFFDEIYELLSDKTDAEIISLEDILCDIQKSLY